MDWYLKLNGTIIDNVSKTCTFHCIKTIEHIFSKSMWALKMIDSSTKVPMSVLKGNIYDFGNFEECLSVNVQEEWGSFTGQHCVAEVPIPYLLNSKYIPKNMTNLPLHWSLCIPSSCSTQDLKLMMRAILPRVNVDPMFCHNKNQHSSFQTIDWIAILILVMLALACMAGTMNNILEKNPEKQSRWLLLFSWYKNGKSLLSTEPQPDSIPVLHGIRLISISWVILGHSYQLYANFPQHNYLDGAVIIRKWRYLFVTNSTLAVDTFFLISGLLLCYIFLKSMNKDHQFNLRLFYIHRFLRILPVLAMMVLLELSLIPKLGNGPLWDIAIVNTQKKDCEDYWWATLLFVQNYIDIKKMCIPVAWFLAVDMQLYWLSPLYLLALHKKPKLGITLVVSSGILGILMAFQQAYYYQDLPSALPTNGLNGDRYYQTHTRYVPWIIGVASGYFLHRSKEWRNRLALGKEHLSKTNVAWGWFLSIAIFIGVIQWLYRYQQVDYEYNVLDASLYFAIARPLWAVGVAWVIFACDSGYGGFVNTILGWNALLPLSRLSFSMYLVHFDILVKSMGMMKVAGYVSEIGLIHSYFGYMVFIVIMSIIMTLTVEAPVIGLEKVLFNRAQNIPHYRRLPDEGEEHIRNSNIKVL